MKLNQTHEEMIRNFAKVNKISCPKLLDFATGLFETVNIHNHKPAGKPVSHRMIKVRESVKQYLLSATEGFTTIDISKFVGCTTLEANSALTYHKQSFNIEVTGKADKEGKGKKPNIYKVIN